MVDLDRQLRQELEKGRWMRVLCAYCLFIILVILFIYYISWAWATKYSHRGQELLFVLFIFLYLPCLCACLKKGKFDTGHRSRQMTRNYSSDDSNNMDTACDSLPVFYNNAVPHSESITNNNRRDISFLSSDVISTPIALPDANARHEIHHSPVVVNLPLSILPEESQLPNYIAATSQSPVPLSVSEGSYDSDDSSPPPYDVAVLNVILRTIE